MSSIAINVKSISKLYRLGVTGTGTLSHDINRWWHRVNGKEDPYQKIGQANERNQKSTNDYVWALNDINFTIQKGDVCGIIGHNGAGKSTLLKILSKITKPTKGEVLINGRIASLLEVGTGFHPEMTGLENIYMNGAILGMRKSEIKQKLEEIVDFSGVQRYIDTPVKRYSSGMKVRLGFAVAAHLEPEILIVDEVLAVGDAEFQQKCIGRMKEVSKNDGRTVLFVSHNIPSIESLCSSVIIMEKGEMSYNGIAKKGIDIYLDSNYFKPKIPIAQRIDRTGNGIVKITDLIIHAPYGLATGRKISVECKYQNQDANVKINEFGMSIWTDRDMKVLYTSTDFKNELKFFPNEGSIFCTIDKLPLVAGNYFINFFICSINGVEDYINHAAMITVENGDFFGTGRILYAAGGVIAIDHNWSLPVNTSNLILKEP